MIHSMPKHHVLARKIALSEKIHLLLVSLHISHHPSEYLGRGHSLQVCMPPRPFTFMATGSQQDDG